MISFVADVDYIGAKWALEIGLLPVHDVENDAHILCASMVAMPSLLPSQDAQP
jgi:hypothetical protein